MAFGDKIVSWVEAHPGESILIGGAGVLGIMWLLGFFSSSGSGGSSQGNNLASAYYGAEAQQAVVGGQIQVANIQATRDTAIAALETNGATAIAKTQAHAAITINGQNADASTTIGQQQLNATVSNNATALAITNSNNATAQAINASNNQASMMTDWMHNILPTEFSTYGANGFQTWLPGGGVFSTGGTLSPNQAAAAGYTNYPYN